LNDCEVKYEGNEDEHIKIWTKTYECFSYTSEIAGMEAGRQACNQMLQAVSDFSSAVLTQANKFPEIAHKIEKRDVELAKRWEH